MAKQEISSNAFISPMPMTVVSSMVHGRVNHLAVAWITRVNANPPLLAAALGRRHFSNQGILETKAFGVSIPSIEQVAAVDYVGLVSGTTTDKSEVFPVFFGGKPPVPMIESFPFTLACEVVQTVQLPTNDLFIAKITGAFCEASCLSGSSPDMAKIRPFALSMPDNQYWELGASLGKAWSIGAGYRK